MLRTVRSARPRSPEPSPSVPVWRTAPGPLRSPKGPLLVARQPQRPGTEHVAVSRDAADLRRRDARDPRRRIHAALSCASARRAAWSRASVHQGRIAQPDQFLQGARTVGGDHASAGAGRDDGVGAVGRQRGQRDGGIRRPAGLEAQVFLPKDVKPPFVKECRLYGANVTLVDGLITDAGRVAAERGGPLGWYDVSTLKEPYRIEGKKTLAFELA